MKYSLQPVYYLLQGVFSSVSCILFLLCIYLLHYVFSPILCILLLHYVFFSCTMYFSSVLCLFLLYPVSRSSASFVPDLRISGNPAHKKAFYNRKVFLRKINPRTADRRSHFYKVFPYDHLSGTAICEITA